MSQIGPSVEVPQMMQLPITGNEDAGLETVVGIYPAVRRPVSSTPVTASRAPKPPKAKPKTKTAGSTAATAARGGDVPWTTAKPTATRSAP